MKKILLALTCINIVIFAQPPQFGDFQPIQAPSYTNPYNNTVSNYANKAFDSFNQVIQNQQTAQRSYYQNMRRNQEYQLQRRIAEARLREIEARTQRIQKSRTNTSRHVSYQKNSVKATNSYKVVGTRFTEYTIRGNGEECKVTYDTKNNNYLYKTNCLRLTNSKGVKILCTKHKKICKTEYELVSSVGTSNSNYFTTEKGTNFRVTYNKHGAILKSKSFTIFLGKSCDVTSPQFGNGIWKDGRHMGFSIQFNNKEIVFPRQQIRIKNNAKCI